MKKYKLLGILLILQLGVQAQPLDELIQQAKEFNPGLKAMQLEYKAALQKAEQVDDWPDPTVNLGLGVLPIETRLGAQRFRVGVSQMIPWKGSLKAKRNVANAMAEIQSYNDEIREKDIENAIRSAYSTLQFLESQKQIINQRLQVLNILEELSKSNISSGKGKLSDALFIERTRKFLEADIDLISKKIEQPTILINRWIGKEVDNKIIVTQMIERNENKVEFIHYATSDHPQYSKLETYRTASNSKIDLIQYDAKPKIRVGIDYSYIDARNDVTIPGNGRDVIMPIGSVSIPLHKGKYSAIRQEEQIKQEAIDLKIQEVQDKYSTEVNLAFSRLEYNNEVIRKYESLKEITKETLKLMRTEYASEGTKFEELLRLEMELIDYDLEITKAKYDQELSHAILSKYK